MGPVLEGGLPDVEPTRWDNAIAARWDGAVAGAQFAGERSGRHPELRGFNHQSSPRKSRRRRRVTALNTLKRLWIPLVIVVVIAAGAFSISKLRSVFGSEHRIPYSDTSVGESKPIDPKYMRYEIFGAPGTVAMISYFGADGSPETLEDVRLPWSLEFPITTAGSIGSIAAQGDTDTIGCRILVGGEVKAEKVEHHEVSSFTSCLLKAA